MSGVRVLLAASEVVPFAKTGGLADVAGSLPRALARRGNTVAVVMPLYNAVRRAGIPVEKTEHVLPVPMGDRTLAVRLYRGKLPNSAVPVYFVEHAPFFETDDPKAGRGLYQETNAAGHKIDYWNIGERFIFFSRAVMEVIPRLGFTPDVVHANDWQTGLVPAYLDELYRAKPGFDRVRSVFTIHNIAYQGCFPKQTMNITGLPGWTFNPAQLEFHGNLSFLKAGIVFSDAVNTVSPTYAREIQTAEFGYGMEGLLSGVRHKLSGIVNGVDYDDWNPATDPHLAAHFTADTVFENKPKCKAALQEHFGLAADPDAPMLGLVARLAHQKGVDLVAAVAPGLLDMGCQIAILGEGDPGLHDALKKLQKSAPDRVGLMLGFNEGLAHKIEAGSDLFLMPSRYEPCGLNQIYSLRYGTPPVVRATGGLADTIVNATEENLADGTATGFAFGAYSGHALYETVKWALHLYRERPDDFRQVVRTAMAQDWSWDRSAAAYEALYRRVMNTPRETRPTAPVTRGV